VYVCVCLIILFLSCVVKSFETSLQDFSVENASHSVNRPTSSSSVAVSCAPSSATSGSSSDGNEALPEERPRAYKKICFLFRDTGACARGELCRFRHGAPEPPRALRRRHSPGSPGKLGVKKTKADGSNFTINITLPR
jgi:hypothetical protein